MLAKDSLEKRIVLETGITVIPMQYPCTKAEQNPLKHHVDVVFQTSDIDVTRSFLDSSGFQYIDLETSLYIWDPQRQDFVSLCDTKYRQAFAYEACEKYPDWALRKARYTQGSDNSISSGTSYPFSRGHSSDTKVVSTINNILSLPPVVVRDQLMKALRSERPSHFFWALQSLSIRAVEHVCKPLADGYLVEQDPRYHTDSVFSHSLKTVDASVEFTQDPLVRLGAMLHDCGKAYTKKVKHVEVPIKKVSTKPGDKIVGYDTNSSNQFHVFTVTGSSTSFTWR